MPAIYLRDLSIREPGQWAGKNALDWLHPCHGPLPDKVGIITLEGYDYCVALWALKDRIVTMTELIDHSKVRDNWEHLASKKGWIVNSLCWKYTPNGFDCAGTDIFVSVEPLDLLNIDGVSEWRARHCRQIMMRSVEITASTPIGCPIFRATDLIKRKPNAKTDVSR